MLEHYTLLMPKKIKTQDDLPKSKTLKDPLKEIMAMLEQYDEGTTPRSSADFGCWCGLPDENKGHSENHGKENNKKE